MKAGRITLVKLYANSDGLIRLTASTGQLIARVTTGLGFAGNRVWIIVVRLKDATCAA